MSAESPSISFLIPTAGRPEIECALASIAPQLPDADEVIVIGDTTDGPLPRSEEIVGSFGPQFRWLDYSNHQHTWGHAELNYGIAHARGDYLAFNDDDDIWTPDAVANMHAAIAQHFGKILLFRFWSRFSVPFWVQQGLLAENAIGGHCIVCPNLAGQVGRWGHHYQGDWTFIESTVQLQGGPVNVVWLEEVIAYARPPDNVRQEVLAKAGRGAVASR